MHVVIWRAIVRFFFPAAWVAGESYVRRPHWNDTSQPRLRQQSSLRQLVGVPLLSSGHPVALPSSALPLLAIV